MLKTDQPSRRVATVLSPMLVQTLPFLTGEPAVCVLGSSSIEPTSLGASSKHFSSRRFFGPALRLRRGQPIRIAMIAEEFDDVLDASTTERFGFGRRVPLPAFLRKRPA